MVVRIRLTPFDPLKHEAYPYLKILLWFLRCFSAGFAFETFGLALKKWTSKLW